MFRRFKKGSKDAAAAALKERERVPAPGDELTRELEDAWYMYTRVSKHDIFFKAIRWTESRQIFV